MDIEQPPVSYACVTPQAERSGLLIVNTGDGKGKSTVRFGEHRMFEQLGISVVGLGDGFSWKSKDLEHSAKLRVTVQDR